MVYSYHFQFFDNSFQLQLNYSIIIIIIIVVLEEDKEANVFLIASS